MVMERRWKGVLVALLLGLWCVGVAYGDAGVVDDESPVVSDKVAPFIKEIERFKAQIRTLDSSLEKKESHISVIEKELAVLKYQKDGGQTDTLGKLEEELESMDIKVTQLEDQVSTATKQSEQAHKYAEGLKKRADTAEESVKDLTALLEKSQALFLASKKHAADVEKALKNAEADVSEATIRLKAHGEELSRVQNQWLPPWAATQYAILRSRASAKWIQHAKPQVDAMYKTASANAAAAREFVKPHLETVFTKVGPELQKHWKTVFDSVAPHVELVRSKTLQGYEVVRKDYLGRAEEFLYPHYTNILEKSRPYVVSVQENTRPYVDQVATASKPYVEKARQFVNPYVEKASPYYRDVVSAALKHHESLQEVVRQNLAKTPLAGHVITQEVVWFLASALLALPVLLAYLLFSSAFGTKKPTKKSKKHTPTSSASSGVTTTHKHKRAKKADK